ncbi:MAG: S41 family peptidase [Lachnospiraceae bacterium]|nr:S41 family peptidase [Lachnospiraceae bacterium]
MNEEFEIQESASEEETMTEKRKPHKWRKRLGKLLMVFVILMVGFVGGVLFLISGSGGSSGINNLSVLKKMIVLENCVEHYYLEDVDEDDLEAGVYRGFMSGLSDPYSTYYTKEEYEQLSETDSGEYTGIGVTVMKDTNTGYVVIEEVQKDAPAYQAGLLKGDILMEVDGTDTATITLQETVNLIKKGENKEVVLNINRDGDNFEVTVEKSSVEIESVTWEMKEGNIGYISVSQFIENTDEKFIEAVDELEEQGMNSLIIDLRDNGGGLLDTCINMVSRIIPENKLIVYTEDKNGKKTEYNSNSDKELKIPIVVLVNENSASASEIMTGCLKDYKAATIVGSTTYGKGIVQNIIQLSDGSAIKLTVSKYYTPNGNYIHKVGIEPDITVEMSNEEWTESRDDPDKDTQLKKAFEILK